MKIYTPLAAIPYGLVKEPIPFQERLPLKLKNSVSGKGDVLNEVCCTYEMSVLFACLKQNEFNESLCGKEVKTFQECYTNYTKSKKLKREREAKGVLIPGEKNLSHKQVNTLLQRFPNIK